jgi:hypothetical protein
VTYTATVVVLAPSVIGAAGVNGVIPTGTVSFNVGDSSCQNRGLALNILVSPTTYQATCTTTFTSAGVTTVTATYNTASTDTTAGSSGSLTQTTVQGSFVTVLPTTPTPAANGTGTVVGNATVTQRGNATTAPVNTGLLYLVILNFQYCVNPVQWAQYLQNLAATLRIQVAAIVVVTNPSATCVPAKRQQQQRSTAVIGFGDLATALAAVNAVNGGQVQGIPGFPDPSAVLASSATASSGLSGGQIAGIVVGSVLGFFLIVALIVIAFILGKKQGGGSEMSGRA